MRYRRTLAVLAAAPLFALAACSSSSSTSTMTGSTGTSTPRGQTAPLSGTETVTAISAGETAAANLNSSSQNSPLTFPLATWTGPVATIVKPFTLPGSSGNGNAAATSTLVTPAGNVTVYHSANQVPGQTATSDTPPPATWTPSGTAVAGTLCHYATTFSEGAVTFKSGTGKFAGATSSAPGTFLVTAQGDAPLSKGQDKCSFTTTGATRASGAQVKFTASFPLTVKASLTSAVTVLPPGVIPQKGGGKGQFAEGQMHPAGRPDWCIGAFLVEQGGPLIAAPCSVTYVVDHWVFVRYGSRFAAYLVVNPSAPLAADLCMATPPRGSTAVLQSCAIYNQYGYPLRIINFAGLGEIAGPGASGELSVPRTLISQRSKVVTWQRGNPGQLYIQLYNMPQWQPLGI